MVLKNQEVAQIFPDQVIMKQTFLGGKKSM